MRCKDDWLLRALVSDGLIDESAAAAVRAGGAPYASKELIRRGTATKEQLAKVVNERYKIPFAEPAAGSIDKMAFALVPEQLCREHLLVPLRLEGEAIDLLMANPLDSAALDAVAVLTGREARAFYGLPDKIEELLAEGYSSDTLIGDILKKMPDEGDSVEVVDYGADSREARVADVSAPVIRLINLIIAQAVRLKASDIHIEHDEKVTMVRYRIDGVLRSMMKVPKQIGDGPLVSRIKIMANLDVADRRRPQDGRAKLKIGREEIGLRVSTIPTAFGEKAVIRILDQSQAKVSLTSMGFRPEILERLDRLAQSNQGLFLLTGPTGSGKTTTLYGILHKLKSDGINIVTVEDPIEYRMEGVNQIQVNDKAGMGFAAVLRSVLRQDPDVILIGEIRDAETADIAFQAAMTGHMVFSTLHTNDAISTIARLVDIGVERYKIAPALIGIGSQRLVRRICRACKAPVPVRPDVGELLKRENFAPQQFEGKGCAACGFTGVSGRIAVLESLDLSQQKTRDALGSAPDDARFKEQALANGWLKTLETDALWHLSNGDASLEELLPLLELLPLPDQPAASRPVPPPAGAAAEKAPETPALKPRRVLIVDDTEANRILIRSTFRNEGYEISEAATGEDALKEIERARPDLVLLDLMMPGMDGFAVVKRLRSELGIADLPILVLTAVSEAESQSMALEMGADDYLIKPFHPKVLRARVKALFRRCEYAGGGAPPGGSRLSEKYSNPDLYLWTEEAFRPLIQETSSGEGKAGVIAFHFSRYREIGAQKSPAIAEHLLSRLATLLRETMRPGDKLGRLGADCLALLMIEDYPGSAKGARRILPLIAGEFRFPVGIGLSHSAEIAGADLADSAVAAALQASGAGSRAVYAAGREGIRPLQEAEASPAAAAPPPSSLLAARYQQLALLNRISLELFSDKPYAESMTSTCRIIMALMNCRYVSIHLCDDFGKPVPSFRYGDDVFASARPGSDDPKEERVVAHALAERRVLTGSKGSAHWRTVSFLPAAKPGPSEDGVLLAGYLEPQSPNEDDDHVLLQIRRLLGNAQFLRKNQERQKIMVAVTEQSADAILVTDLESRVILCNPSAQALFQYDMNGILGRSYGLLIQEDRKEEAALREREALRTGSVGFETVARLGRGGLVPAEVNFTPLRNEKGAAFGMVCVFRDITRRKEVDRMKTEFVALVSHELRTPLTAIQGFAETIFDFWSELKPEELKRYLGIILDESKRLGMLVTNFLDISRLESGAVELNCREIQLQTLTGRLTSLFVDHPSQAVFKVAIEPGSGVVYADEEQLYRVLLNLCGNALKYSPAKGTITISCRRSEGMTEISVSDQGPGIPMEDQSRIFDKFYRVADPISQKTPGTGLGLAICQGIVAHHGGKIWVESAPGRGTSFKFTLRNPPNEKNTDR